MRIAFISREYPPETGWGGIGTYVYRMSHALAEAGHEVHVISRSERLEEYARQDGPVMLHRVRERKYAGLFSDWLYGLLPIGEWRYSRRVAQKIGELHKHAPFDIIEAAEYRAEAFHIVGGIRVPVVVKLHSPSYLLDMMSRTLFSFRERVVDRMERVTTKRAAGVTSPSKELANLVSKFWSMPPSRVAHVPNPLGSIHEELPWPGNETPPTALFVGRIDHRKGADVMADAVVGILHDLPEARFILVGAPGDKTVLGGDRSLYDRIVALWRQAGVLDRITLVPWQKDTAALQKYYCQAHVALVPSIFENFPNVCLEAMLASRAVVASEVGGIPEIIQDGTTGLLVPPARPEALCQATVSLLRNRQRAQMLGQAGRTSVIERFNASKVAAETAAFYEKTISAYQVSQKPPRVLAIVTERWINWGKEEGVAVMVPEFLRALERAGMTTHLIHRDYRPSHPPAGKRSGLLAWVGELAELAWDLTEPLRNLVFVIGCWLRNPTRFELIWEYYAFYGFSGCILSWITGRPLIFNVDSPLIEEYEKLQGVHLGLVRRSMGRWILKCNLARAARVHVPSTVLARWLIQDYGISPDKICVIPNGVLLDKIKAPQDRQVLRRRHGLGDEPVVLFVGSLQPWHGCDVLVQAFAKVYQRCPSARLLIVGDGKVRQSLEAQVKTLGLNGSVRFAGYVPHTQVPEFLAIADVAVLPYPELPVPFYFSPIKLFEYMGAGRAIVASRSGQIAEILRDGETGRLVSPGSVDELAQALIELCTSPDRGAALGRQAQLEASHCTWQQRGELLARICREALGSSHG